MYENLFFFFLYEHKLVTALQEVWEGYSDSIITCKLFLPTYEKDISYRDSGIKTTTVIVLPLHVSVGI